MPKTLASLQGRHLCRRGTIARDVDGNYIIANDPDAGVIQCTAELPVGAQCWYIAGDDDEVLLVGRATTATIGSCPVEITDGQ